MTVKEFVPLKLGKPLSVTFTFTVLVVLACATAGRQLNRPLLELMFAPAGGFTSAKASVFVGRSASVAVAVKLMVWPGLTVRLVSVATTGATNSFTVIVNEVNVAPVVGTLTNRTVNPGQTISFTATATDADLPTNTLTFALVSPPSGATLTGGGLFNWRPTTAQANTTNTVKVKVTDNGSPNLSGTNSFTVVVNPLAATTLAVVSYTNGYFTMQVSGTSGPDYIISASTNLTLWTDIFTNLSPATPFQYTDTNAALFPDRFYRARLSP